MIEFAQDVLVALTLLALIGGTLGLGYKAVNGKPKEKDR